MNLGETLASMKAMQAEMQKMIKQFTDFTNIMGEALASTIREKDKLKSQVGILEMRNKDLHAAFGQLRREFDAIMRQPGAYLQ